jgi:hypothetical protein
MLKTRELDTDDTETKVVQLRDGQGTQHALMMTRALPGAQSPLSEEGYRDETVFFTVIAGGVCVTNSDPYKLVDKSVSLGRNDFVF